MDDKEQLLQQRQQLNKRLGLDIAGGLGLDNNLFSDEDLRINTVPGTNNNSVVSLDFFSFGLFIFNFVWLTT